MTSDVLGRTGAAMMTRRARRYNRYIGIFLLLLSAVMPFLGPGDGFAAIIGSLRPVLVPVVFVSSLYLLCRSVVDARHPQFVVYEEGITVRKGMWEVPLRWREVAWSDISTARFRSQLTTLTTRAGRNIYLVGTDALVDAASWRSSLVRHLRAAGAEVRSD